MSPPDARMFPTPLPPEQAGATGPMAQLRSARLWAVAAALGAITMMWTTYEQYVPGFLGDTFGLPALVIALVLTTDNLLGFFLEPLTGILSDRTRTAIGKRLPWVLLGTPIAVGFFALLPIPVLMVPPTVLGAQEVVRDWMNPFTLFIIGMLVAMAIFRTPTVALMPDLAASPGRSVANGLLQTLSGLGALGTFLLGDWLVRTFNIAAPFWLASGVMVAAAFFLWLLVARHQVEEEYHPIPYPSHTYRDLLLLVAAIGAWWLGFVFLRAFLGEIGAGRWLFSEVDQERYIELFMLGFTVASIPAGLIASRWGRRRTVAIGTVALMLFVSLLALIASSPLIAGLLLLGGGICWAAIVVNSLPMLLDLGPEGRLGTSTGLYYLAFALAGLSGPWLVRLARPALAANGIWLAILAWLVALVLIQSLALGSGEVEWEPE